MTRRIAHRAGQTGAGLIDPPLERLGVRARRVQGRARPLELGERNEFLVVAFLRPFVGARCLCRVGSGGVTIVEERFDRRFRTRCRRGQLSAVDLKEKIALLDDVAFADGQIRDLTHHVRGEIHLALGLDLSVRRHFARQVGPLDLRRCHLDDLLCLLLDDAHCDDGHEQQRDHPEDDLRPSFHDRLVLLFLSDSRRLYGDARSEFFTTVIVRSKQNGH